MRQAVRWILLPAALGAAALAGGFLWFVGGIGAAKPPSNASTDAIVVLTGGRDRIARGLTLLAQGKAKKLFVSGVGRGIAPEELERGSGVDRALVACCVVLGYDADNTTGNAVETADWLRQERYHSLRLVTSDYHIRRALLEFGRVLPPGFTVIADPVAPTIGARRRWQTTARILVLEYVKFLVALARPSFAQAYAALSPHGNAPTAAARPGLAAA
jgi:uncharacterized SAM-binding protein YcdF (DUF218 family)